MQMMRVTYRRGWGVQRSLTACATLIALLVCLPVAAVSNEAICKRYSSVPFPGYVEILGTLFSEASISAPNGRIVVCLYEADDFLGAAADVVVELGQEEAWLVGFQRRFNDQAAAATIRFFFMHEVGHFMLKHGRACTDLAARKNYEEYTACESTADIYAGENVGFCEAAVALQFLQEFTERYAPQPVVVAKIFEQRIDTLRKGRLCNAA